MNESKRLTPNRQRYGVSREDMTVHLVEDRRASVSPWGLGNSKLGPGVYTYSKLPGIMRGSCPGSTEHCEAVCMPKRIGNPWVESLWAFNQRRGDALPVLPDDALLVRGHVSGDFDTPGYVESWIALAVTRPGCQFWFYTRSWRVPTILLALEELRAQPNVQMWASMDADCELPPRGWRRAWLDSDPRAVHERRGRAGYKTQDGVLAIACPEEVGTKANCVACTYCFRPGRGDLVFLEHTSKEGA